ncbi:unnamed protein product (macronuclear) [Paramecium tetraurelia]|uniref:CUE domain-containing protein n=1 Tax=Paramecium tetraurelia TaxID=5888 RepID=A0EAJ1_PARTE|nr:uncharacterized protein GSPATT00025041001 [Paramecium tetraurelia]CAK92308.1 unnamed protein product [Paramecium tetraurelia]|eukprot:XP_001459705.1 hypothetical protein (macronuclear) [Paramecium tetraurelia strain d4-2]
MFQISIAFSICSQYECQGVLDQLCLIISKSIFDQENTYENKYLQNIKQMSNIKFVYQRKVHKLPAKVQNYQEIVETIKTIYPQLKEVHLFTIINPSRDLNLFLDHPIEIEEINCDFGLTFLKKLYKQMRWPTIKLLLLENEKDENQIKNSIDLLNQSTIILDQSNYQSTKPKTEQEIENLKAREQQKQVNDYKKDEKLKQTLIEIIDERLRYHKLLNSNTQETDMIEKAKQLSQIFPYQPQDQLLEFVKHQGSNLSLDKLASLLTQNQ